MAHRTDALDMERKWESAGLGYFMGHHFQEILMRPGLERPTRLLCAIAALLVTQSEAAVEMAIESALDSGAQRQQIVDVIIQTGCFTGFPKWAIGSKPALRVFRRRGLVPPADPEWDRLHGVLSKEYDASIWNKDGLWEKGWAKRDEIAGADTPTGQDELAKFDPLLVQYHMEVRYGEIYCRPGLDVKLRELCRLAAFLSTGEAFAAKGAIEGALNVGATPQEVHEVVLQTGTLHGFSKWATGARLQEEVFRERNLFAPGEA
jgi:4-carboxymuconolactone decarboxylase